MALKPLTAFKPLQSLSALRPLVEEPSSLGDTDGENPEEIALNDHQKMMKGLREQQAAALAAANDTGYWFAVYFQSSQQKEAFLAAFKTLKTAGTYVDGLELAAELKIPIPDRSAKYKTGTLDKKCAAIARTSGVAKPDA